MALLIGDPGYYGWSLSSAGWVDPSKSYGTIQLHIPVATETTYGLDPNAQVVVTITQTGGPTLPYLSLVSEYNGNYTESNPVYTRADAHISTGIDGSGVAYGNSFEFRIDVVQAATGISRSFEYITLPGVPAPGSIDLTKFVNITNAPINTKYTIAGPDRSTAGICRWKVYISDTSDGVIVPNSTTGPFLGPAMHGPDLNGLYYAWFDSTISGPLSLLLTSSGNYSTVNTIRLRAVKDIHYPTGAILPEDTSFKDVSITTVPATVVIPPNQFDFADQSNISPMQEVRIKQADGNPVVIGGGFTGSLIMSLNAISDSSAPGMSTVDLNANYVKGFFKNSVFSAGNQISIANGDTIEPVVVSAQAVGSVQRKISFTASIITNASGQTLFPVTSSQWSSWMNARAVWVNANSSPLNGQSISVVYRNVTVPTTGIYTIKAEADDDLGILIDGVQVMNVTGFTAQGSNERLQIGTVYLTAGVHVFGFKPYNTTWASPSAGTWTANPGGFAVECLTPSSSVLFTTHDLYNDNTATIVSDSFFVSTRMADTLINSFDFTNISNIDPNTICFTNVINILDIDQGITLPVACAGSDSSLIINGTDLNSKSGTVKLGDTVQIRAKSAAAFNGVRDYSVTVSGSSNVTDGFTVTTRPPRATVTLPFGFLSRSNLTPSVWYLTNAIQFTNLETSVAISVTNGATIVINGVDTASSSGTINNNDVISLRGQASANYLTTKTFVVTINGLSESFSFTTRQPSTTATAFGFTTLDWQIPSDTVVSDVVTVNGFDIALTATMTSTDANAVLYINGSASGTSGSISAGQTVQIQSTAPAGFGDVNTYQISIGGTIGTWTVKTVPCGEISMFMPF